VRTTIAGMSPALPNTPSPSSSVNGATIGGPRTLFEVGCSAHAAFFHSTTGLNTPIAGGISHSFDAMTSGGGGMSRQ
jgi:hypothetical protein